MTGGKPRVLIVEKSNEKRTTLKNILRNGFQILEAKDEREAAELLKKSGVDLCVMRPDRYLVLTGQTAIYCTVKAPGEAGITGSTDRTPEPRSCKKENRRTAAL